MLSVKATITIFAAAWSAFIVSLIYTPLVRRYAIKRGFVDQPDGRRKIHTNSVALGGGYVILVSTLIGVASTSCSAWYFFPGQTVAAIPNAGSLAGLALAAIVLCLAGLVDDRSGMRGGVKLLWQIAAASLVIFVGDGLSIGRMDIFGFTTEFGLVGVLFTFLWLLGAVNSVNLIDGIDGLASTIGLICSMTLGVMAIMTNHLVDAVIAFSMAGALLGFLRFNFSPASIYLGDAGSMLIGLVLGTIALRCSIKEAATIALAGPLAIMAIPMFDSVAAILRRKLTGRSLYTTDRGHIHHRLLTRGLTHTKAVVLIGALCSLTACGSLASIYFQNEMMGILIVVAVLVLMVSARMFGHVELLLLNNQLMGFGRSFWTYATNRELDAVHGSVQLQGSKEWEQLWEAIVDSTDRFQLTRIRLNLVLPRLHEDFYAAWTRKSRAASDRQWHTSLPLVIDGETVGRLEVSGAHESEESAADIISHYLEFLDPLEQHLRMLLKDSHESKPVEACDSDLQHSLDDPKSPTDVVPVDTPHK
jgi:UDP-GlcNAc:undecaprenyl-phosphate GlcNAc-1-phosphate transferase